MSAVLAKVTGFAIVLSAIAICSDSDVLADPALRQYTLTAHVLTRAIEATKAMRTAEEHSTAFRKEADSEQPVTASLRETIAGIVATRPLHVKVIENSGISVDDYFLTFFAVFQAQIVASRGENWQAIRKYTNPKNITFIRQHADEVKRLVAEISALNALKEHGKSGVP